MEIKVKHLVFLCGPWLGYVHLVPLVISLALVTLSHLFTPMLIFHAHVYMHIYLWLGGCWSFVTLLFCFAVDPRVGIWWLIIGTLCFLYDLWMEST